MQVQDKTQPNRWAARVGKALRNAVGLASSFVADRRGNVVMMVGLAGIPLLVAAGAGIDYTRALVVKQRLSHALDAAALAVGSSLDRPVNELEQLAQDYFDANYPAAEIGVPGTLNVSVDDDIVNMSASADVKTTFIGLIGKKNVDVDASTQVVRKISGLEVVMVLDNTGSMSWGGKIGALKTAANDLVDILFGDETTPQYLKVGLVPFSAAVNVGTEYKNAGWIDTTGQSSVHDDNFNFAGMSGVDNRFDVFDLINNKDWNGCVEARPMPYDIQDTPPNGTVGDTLWVPYFAPDEPSWNGYSNSYIWNDQAQSGWSAQQRQANLLKYNNTTINSDGPHYNCKTTPITPLTNQRTVIEDAIEAMNATGNTNISFGMAWGWRVVSPGEPFTEGVAYDDKDYDKAIILLTDGQNVIGGRNNHNRSSYGAYGYVKDGRLGTTNANAAQSMLDERTKDVCQNIKDAVADEDKKIIIYTITFQLNDGPTKDMMRDCASDPEKYFDSVSNEELKKHFNAIASELSDLRLSK